MMIKKEEFRDALLEAGAKSLVSANGLATRIFGKRDEVEEQEIIDHYTESKSKFKERILSHFGLEEKKITREDREEEKMLDLMLSDKKIVKFPRKLGENDREYIERYCTEQERKKPKMASFCANKAVDVENKVKIKSKYFDICISNK
jgi:hypothetical protein